MKLLDLILHVCHRKKDTDVRCEGEKGYCKVVNFGTILILRLRHATSQGTFKSTVLYYIRELIRINKQR
jgi:hypothetical protein